MNDIMKLDLIRRVFNMRYSEMREELTKYYLKEADSRAEEFCDKCLEKLDSAYREGMSVFAMKRMQYRVIAENIDPVLFFSSPFYYETGTLAAQCDGARDFRGHRSAGGWVYWKNSHLFKEQDLDLWQLVKKQKNEKMYLICGPYNDTSQHFCFNYRPVLRYGLKGIYEQAFSMLDGATDDEKDFLISVCEGMECLKKISEKFALKAESMAVDSSDPIQRAYLQRISRSAKKVPWEAPESFYEALNTYAFLRKAIGALEGIGFSSFGRIDMDLYPFYKKDIDEGKITREEAYELIGRFIVTFDCHYDHDMKFEGYSDHELENTYVLGGCDYDGKPLCNDLTMMFLRATREERVIYPKIKLRYSSESPKEMLDEANIDLVNGRSVILYQNDESCIPALVKLGRTLEEARDYIVYGCWGMSGNGNEKHDDGPYVNLVKPLELSVHRDFNKMREIGMSFKPIDDAVSFEEVYNITKENMRVLLQERSRITRAGGNIWSKVDVLPIFSSTLQNCIKNKKDYTEGGAKYRDDRNAMFSFPTVVDSLLAIKELCFDKKKYSLQEYLEAVRNNWIDNEEMRIDAINCHGWGDGSDEAGALASRLNNDLSEILSTLKGTYGGKIVVGYIGYTEVRWWGEVTRATPDGRKYGDYLTQGLTPSRLKKIKSVTNVINNFTYLDAAVMGGNSVVNLILPSSKMDLNICEAILRASTKSSMQSMQLNCTSKETLLDAQKNPEKYPDLVVRVAGFSAKFTSLSPEWQNEIITRNFYER